jgi:hypothetical protein
MVGYLDERHRCARIGGSPTYGRDQPKLRGDDVEISRAEQRARPAGSKQFTGYEVQAIGH